MTHDIKAVAFDCFGTLIDFSDEAFATAYGVICAEQGVPIDGQTFYDKWMEVWRRLANVGESTNDGAPGPSNGNGAASLVNRPAALSEAEPLPPHPEHHTPSAGRNRALDGPVPEFKTYREEWTEHFAICFEELGVEADAAAAHERLRELLAQGSAFPESRRVVERVGRRLQTAMLSNADNDFLHPVLSRNGLVFPVIVSSESARVYKPHAAIFRTLADELGVVPESILYVGDSRLADITGARNAGLRAAWLNRRRSMTEVSAAGRNLLEPDFEIETLDALLGILDIA
ncbi:MAG TPA: HAD family hydrolase [Dehalococcoidia bacterium]|nr:HAD family hydrolase [Dehalococcoidia bacterium]